MANIEDLLKTIKNLKLTNRSLNSNGNDVKKNLNSKKVLEEKLCAQAKKSQEEIKCELLESFMAGLQIKISLLERKNNELQFEIRSLKNHLNVVRNVLDGMEGFCATIIKHYTNTENKIFLRWQRDALCLSRKITLALRMPINLPPEDSEDDDDDLCKTYLRKKPKTPVVDLGNIFRPGSAYEDPSDVGINTNSYESLKAILEEQDRINKSQKSVPKQRVRNRKNRNQNHNLDTGTGDINDNLDLAGDLSNPEEDVYANDKEEPLHKGKSGDSTFGKQSSGTGGALDQGKSGEGSFVNQASGEGEAIGQGKSGEGSFVNQGSGEGGALGEGKSAGGNSGKQPSDKGGALNKGKSGKGKFGKQPAGKGEALDKSKSDGGSSGKQPSGKGKSGRGKFGKQATGKGVALDKVKSGGGSSGKQASGKEAMVKDPIDKEATCNGTGYPRKASDRGESFKKAAAKGDPNIKGIFGQEAATKGIPSKADFGKIIRSKERLDKAAICEGAIRIAAFGKGHPCFDFGFLGKEPFKKPARHYEQFRLERRCKGGRSTALTPDENFPRDVSLAKQFKKKSVQNVPRMPDAQVQAIFKHLTELKLKFAED